MTANFELYVRDTTSTRADTSSTALTFPTSPKNGRLSLLDDPTEVKTADLPLTLNTDARAEDTEVPHITAEIEATEALAIAVNRYILQS